MKPFNSSPLTYRQKKIVWMILGRHGTSASPLSLPAHHFFRMCFPYFPPLSPHAASSTLCHAGGPTPRAARAATPGRS